jgi:1L-myo-inositol 1-phosphate cytidylyltransferase / CDP-L-myo-inositol myo-inositolphosphotransferase
MTGEAPTTLWISSAGKDGRSGVAGDTVLLGLPLLRRAVLAGERAGFERIIVEEAAGLDLQRLLVGTRAEIAARSGAAPDPGPGRLVILRENVIPQVRWLRELRQRTRESRLDTGARGEPESRDRFAIASAADLARAEDWLLESLVKDTEGFMSRHVERRISLAVSRRLAATRVTPNAMTLFSVGVGLAGALLFLSSRPGAPLLGALLVLLHSILDGCDGELARLKFQESRFGGVLDFWGDNVVHSALFGTIAMAWSRASGQAWPLLLGAAAILGTILSAAFVYRHTMAQVEEGPLFTSVTRSPESPFSRLADALARRDFLYLLVALAAFGKERWFLAMAALGSPIYFLLLLAIARAGRRRETPAAEEAARVAVRVNNPGS